MRAPEIPQIWADPDRILTVEDMEDMPDDEFRYELDNGMLIVHPVPPLVHQLAVIRLAFLLHTACPPELLTIVGPGTNIDRFQHRVPDLAVIRVESFREMFLLDPPVLAVEVASPLTRVYDLGRKKEVYERFGVRSYWIVEPGPDKPELTVFELRRGRYTETARAVGTGAVEVTRPFPATIVLADLVEVTPS